MANVKPGTILLTGAGFTHNFGGYLAKDMWAEIFNHEAVQKYPRLQETMRTGEVAFNFEGVYDKVLYGKFSGDEKTAISEAVISAFQNLDDIVRGFRESVNRISLNSLARFIERFAGTLRNPGYFFTLNQDLFVERRLPFEKILVLPGLKRGDRFNTRFNDLPIESIRIRLPESLSDANESGHLLYVKLHGSMEWLGHDRSFRPVIGTQKTRLIEREPLLKWYGGLFREALTGQSNRKLVVIGYGFRDDHINDMIAEACKTHGLKVYVVGPENPEVFHHGLHGKGLWQQIWKGWAGYYRWTLLDLFTPSDVAGPGKIALRNLVQAVFES